MLTDARGLWVKVDGLTSKADIVAAAEAGVSAVGLIFAPSKRRVTLEQARELRRAIPESVLAFGVFDGTDTRSLAGAMSILRLDGVQLPAAGALTVGDLNAVPRSTIVLRTVRVRSAADLASLGDLECDAVHLDAFVDGELGGTGSLAPWDVIAGARPSRPFVLSGGLRADNVADGVRLLHPAGVDSSSGVESSPGVKDHDKMRAFVEAARTA